MTYQASSQEFSARIPARGQSISSAPFMSARRALRAIGGLFKSIGDSYCKAALASSRLQMVQMLNDKSDAELADLDIKREDIVHYVFRDLYHI